jgi:hypothetical protein
VCLVAPRHLVLFEPGLKTSIERVSSVLRVSFNVLKSSLFKCKSTSSYIVKIV